MKLTFKETKFNNPKLFWKNFHIVSVFKPQYDKFNFIKDIFAEGEILNVVKNTPTALQGIVFNQLKNEYATKVITKNFNFKIYEKLFIERNLADYISMVEEISSEK